MTEDQLVTMTIPAPLLPAVTSLMQDYFAGATTAPDGSDDRRTVESIRGLSWDRSTIRALHSRSRSQRSRALMRLIAERSIEGLTTSYGQLMAHLDTDSFGLRSDLAWLGRHATAVQGEKAFPLIVTDAGSHADPGTRLNYRMPRGMAGWWLEADDAESVR
jgi:hypothetical protein